MFNTILVDIIYFDFAPENLWMIFDRRLLPRSQLPSKLLVSGHPVTVDPRQLGVIMIMIGIMMMIMKMVIMIDGDL